MQSASLVVALCLWVLLRVVFDYLAMFSAGLPSSVRLCFGQPCSPTRNGRFARPCDRSTYTYMPSGRSPARLVSFSRVPPGYRPKTKPRMAPLVEFVARRVPSASLPFHTVMLPRLSLAIRVVMPCRRDTGSLPHSRLSAQSANRIPACHSAQRSATLPASSLHVKPIQATSTVTNQPTRLKASAKQAEKLSLSDST